ncbi:MAG: hypothetical protein IKP48_11345 [Bacteroidaceae bacterium]|nr:hypothetical protein [Bacteroidaceae bacterium]
MKKKMLFMAAIAGLISLGSCVKDDVSGSVEAVRQAKANELNGKANNENAQANLNNANAELVKATQAAKVAQEQAKALSDAANARIDEANAKLKEDALAEELESIVADFLDKTATSKASQQAAINALQTALRAAATANYDDIAALIANYQLAFNNYTAAEAALVTAKANLEKAKIDSDYAEEVNAATIKGLEDTIAEQEALLAALKEVKATNPTQAEINAKAQAITAQADEDAAAFENNPAIGEFLKAAAAWGKAYAAYNAYVNTTDGVITELNKKVSGIDPGKEYLTKETNPSATIAPLPGKQFADYKGYDVKAGANTPDKWGPMGTIKTNGYRVSEEGELIINDYLKNYTKTQQTAVKNAKAAKADLEGQLGKSTDKKDTKFKDSKGNEAVTLYGALAGAQEGYDKAKKALDEANANLTGKPAAVAAAYDKLLAVAKAKTFKGTDWIEAVVGLADAMVDAYGEPAYDPNKKKFDYSKPADIKDAIDYLFGSTTHAGIATETDLDEEKEVAALFDSTDANCLVKTWGKDAKKKDASEIKLVEDVINRAAGAKNVIDAQKTAKTAADNAKKAVDNAQKAINDQPQKIAAAQDAINAAQEKLDNAEADKKEITELVAAADSYSNVVQALQDASTAYNKAYEAVDTAAWEVNSQYLQAAQIAATTPQDIENKIAAATSALANAKASLAKAEADNHSTDGPLATAEQAVKDAEADLALATAELAAAMKDIEESGIEFDLDGDDDEPTEEPIEGGEGDGEAPGEETPEVVAPADGE